MPGGFAAEHGSYLPDPALTWESVDGEYHQSRGDHHRVWLMVERAGRNEKTGELWRRRQRVLIGEVRRAGQVRPACRQWRAFPEGPVIEFLPPFPNHYQALRYLRQQWETRAVRLMENPFKVPRRPPARKPYVPDSVPEKPPAWTGFFGDDLWHDMTG